MSGFENIDKVINKIVKTIDDDPPVNMLNGGYVKDGFSEKLDRTRKLSNNSKQWLIDLQDKEKKKNDIPSLKIKYNKVFGYYIEVTKAHIDKVQIILFENKL